MLAYQKGALLFNDAAANALTAVLCVSSSVAPSRTAHIVQVHRLHHLILSPRNTASSRPSPRRQRYIARRAVHRHDTETSLLIGPNSFNSLHTVTPFFIPRRISDRQTVRVQACQAKSTDEDSTFFDGGSKLRLPFYVIVNASSREQHVEEGYRAMPKGRKDLERELVV